MHTIFFPPSAGQLAPTLTVHIDGDESRHALLVKRVHTGDPVRLLDGVGSIAQGRIVDQPAPDPARSPRKRERSLYVQIDSVTTVPESFPTLDVCSATPKGQRVDELIEGLCEVGATSWSPLHSERSVVEPRPTKLDRLDRVAIEAMKQCGRARRLRINPSMDFADSLCSPTPAYIIMADASGAPYVPSTAPHVRLLIGPEGGWSPAELAAAAASGVHLASFGRHVMRIETAAVVASGVILATSRTLK